MSNRYLAETRADTSNHTWSRYVPFFCFSTGCVHRRL